MTWDPNNYNEIIYFSDLKKDIEYKFLIEDAQQLISESKKKQHDISFNIVTANDFETNKSKIECGSTIVLKIWRSFFDKWNQCMDHPIKTIFPVTITIIRLDKKKWYIKNIINYEVKKNGI